MARRTIALAGLGLSSIALVGMSPDAATLGEARCQNGECTLQLTAAQLLDRAQALVLQRRFEEAAPLLAALHQAPQYKMESEFLDGYVAAEQGRLDDAARNFRLVLQDHPGVTRARLELARVLMMQGKDEAAEHHYRLAAHDRDLPPEIAKTISDQRGILRNRKRWYFNVNFGVAPDSNVNNATDARAIDVTLGNTTLPLELDNKARRRPGFGQSVGISTGIRLRLKDGLALAVDADAQAINQKGTDADDISGLLAIGPELTIRNTRVSVQALAAERRFGGRTATRGLGVRTNFQRNLDDGQRIGLQFDVRHNGSDYGPDFEGWQLGAYASYEHVVDHSMVASATLFVRRESLGAAAYSNTEVGGSIGIGGELPHGINAGLSLGISRALFDAPMPLLSAQPRRDWRPNVRAYLGLRSVKLLGFSPSITYTYNASLSSLPLYKTTRSRVLLGVARYF